MGAGEHTQGGVRGTRRTQERARSERGVRSQQQQVRCGGCADSGISLTISCSSVAIRQPEAMVAWWCIAA